MTMRQTMRARKTKSRKVVRRKTVRKTKSRHTLLCGDNRLLLRTIRPNSVDSAVTDPPYALASIVKRFGKKNSAPAKGNAAFIRASRGFMGQTWDNADAVHDPKFWQEVYRVLKPGAFLIAFGGTRTYHRMVCAIEDAGFEIRDMVQWLYGSGFPKSHDVSKGIDKAAGAVRKILGKRQFANGSFSRDAAVMGGNTGKFNAANGNPLMTAPSTKAAREWEGWGTALKPACEPICMARKPLSEKTVAANVLKWGTGAINIDGCRVESNPRNPGYANHLVRSNSIFGKDGRTRPLKEEYDTSSGRFPANVITDGSDEVVAMFPNSNGQQGNLKGHNKNRKSPNGIYGGMSPALDHIARNDTGSAARFFYCAKASKKDRAGSKHPTVKPVSLIRHFCRMVTPPGGIVLDPFAGTGTLAAAAQVEGFQSIMIENEKRFQRDIQRRVKKLKVETLRSIRMELRQAELLQRRAELHVRNVKSRQSELRRS